MKVCILTAVGLILLMVACGEAAIPEKSSPETATPVEATAAPSKDAIPSPTQMREESTSLVEAAPSKDAIPSPTQMREESTSLVEAAPSKDAIPSPTQMREESTSPVAPSTGELKGEAGGVFTSSPEDARFSSDTTNPPVNYSGWAECNCVEACFVKSLIPILFISSQLSVGKLSQRLVDPVPTDQLL